MKILEFLSAKAMSADLKSSTKADVITELIELFIEAGVVEKKHNFLQEGRHINQRYYSEAT